MTDQVTPRLWPSPAERIRQLHLQGRTQNAKSAAIPESVRRQLASLTHRVSWLEAALRPKKDKAPVDRVWADYLRRSANQKTRDDAMQEYREQEKLARYREHPHLVKSMRELELLSKARSSAG